MTTAVPGPANSAASPAEQAGDSPSQILPAGGRAGGPQATSAAPAARRTEEAAAEADDDQAGDVDRAEHATITALEYLEQQNALEKEARRSFPKKFDKCTFALGYVKQPVYGCLSAKCRQGGPAAGFCYACSISCHADHQVIELSTKRHFRCDCGTSRSANTECTLLSPEDERHKPHQGKRGGAGNVVANVGNSYDHNFDGRYCWCDRPYIPETDGSTMFQCVVCQDWRHEECIGPVPPADSFEAYICRSCTAERPFLKRYNGRPLVTGILRAKPFQVEAAGFAGPGGARLEDAGVTDTGRNCHDDVDVEACNAQAESRARSDASELELGARAATRLAGNTERSPACLPRPIGIPENSRKRGAAESRRHASPATKRTQKPESSEETAKCRWKSLPDVDAGTSVDLFCRTGWRQELCQCQTCIARFGSSLRLLLDEEDEYEPEDDDEDDSAFDLGMRALNALPHSTQIDGALAYRQMRDEIMGFLSTFARTGTAVSRDDVVGFFEVGAHPPFVERACGIIKC